MFVATACGTAEHAAALAAAKTWATAHSLGGPVRCTTGISTPYRTRANDFFCIAHRSAVVCDEARVDRHGNRWVAVSYRQKVDCVLPA
jgi:hypothetical protein